jgi:methylated-DNA-[protein]-cysteine S-methyltransferase
LQDIDFAIFPSSLGNLVLVGRLGKIIGLSVARDAAEVLEKRVRQRYPSARRNEVAFRAVSRELGRYLRGEVADMAIPVDLSGQTAFTKRVLEVVRGIPFGETRSYGWVAEKAGCPGGARAVGQAVARNPVPIIVPCHRVVREDGSLGGFSMEGVSKAYLLRLEGVVKAER